MLHNVLMGLAKFASSKWQTLKKWNESERLKRAQHRKHSSQSIPPPPVTLADLSRAGSTLIRRTRTLSKTGWSSRSRASTLSSRDSTELESTTAGTTLLSHSEPKVEFPAESRPMSPSDLATEPLSEPQFEARRRSAVKSGSRFVEDLSSQLRKEPVQLGTILEVVSESDINRPNTRPSFNQLPSLASVNSIDTLQNLDRSKSTSHLLREPGQDEVEDEEDGLERRSPLGFWEWLMFGCWGRRADDEQSSKTNPME